ncbi:MAG: SDR family oxidoreductase [Bacteroidetes bacterium]|nr:SDR family oxidoreductase [Rhodothermia bacterium]MCS7155802.1 SDR family oxidoreductase [Bacteroidota bacterium]MCX7906097.1 SDR family oxidoreductase [Bacteroidota bacterium]MDW8138225.1 SDR family oxidoreductase [Bacteroidota bacterium]MDW8285909.1 SDR family oxidoreductase [Bacteroidota bacterium]
MLRDRVVVITGAGRLGRALVRLFSQSEPGGLVVISRRAESLHALEVSGQPDASWWGLTADLTQEAEVQAAFEAVHARWGRLDVLIHTVGTWAGSPLLETSLEAWEDLMRLNLNSAFLCFREALRWMQPRRYGRLIAIASMQGLERGRSGQAAYSASKAGLIRLVESVALEYWGSGITANAIAPSLIREADQEGPGVSAEAVARLCLFLAQEEAGAISGETLRIYGDYPIL